MERPEARPEGMRALVWRLSESRSHPRGSGGKGPSAVSLGLGCRRGRVLFIDVSAQRLDMESGGKALK